MPALNGHGDGFLAYARSQHEFGTELLARHAPEQTGCCRDCGRVFPCEAHEQGIRMTEHYGYWLQEPVTLKRPDTHLP
jgi:hypothetical protein